MRHLLFVRTEMAGRAAEGLQTTGTGHIGDRSLSADSSNSSVTNSSILKVTLRLTPQRSVRAALAHNIKVAKQLWR
jgi:hypothetical protein